MATAIGSSPALRRPARRLPRRVNVGRRPLGRPLRAVRTVPAPITRQQVIASWERALGAAEAAAEAACAGKAISRAELGDAERRLREERKLLARFERESRARWPEC
jgi:hypothetical protein